MIIRLTILICLISSLNAQKTGQDSIQKKFFVGSSFFILANLNTKQTNPPDFIQLNFGYRIASNDFVSIEIKTWRYAWPLGIPYGKSFEASDEKYPGYVRTFGIALVYQRFLWKDFYVALHAMNALQKYEDQNNKRSQNGYLLFMTYRLGYHLAFSQNRFFIEPSVAMTHWPINTNVPESFARLEKKWPNYFLFEPGLHFGFKF